MNYLKTVIVSGCFISSVSQGGNDLLNSPWVNPPNRGITVEIDSPSNPALSINGTTKITGKIKYKRSNGENLKSHGDSDKDDHGKNKKDDLLSYLKDTGFEIRATFPSSVVNVTNDLVLESQNQDHINFSYVIPAVQEASANQFTIEVLATSNETNLYKNLERTKSKLEKRIRALELRIANGNFDKNVVLHLRKSQSRLFSIVKKISEKFGQMPSLVASSQRALQVSNFTSAQSSATTTMHKTRSAISVNPGAAIEGMKSEVVFSFSNLRGGSDAGESESRVVRLYQDDNLIFQSQPQVFPGGSKIEFSKMTEKLLPSKQNEFRAELYGWDSDFQRILERKTYVFVKIPTADDIVAPQWLSEGSPFQELHYARELSLVDLKIKDDFGRIDVGSLKLNLDGTLLDETRVVLDLSSKILSAIENDGASVHFTGNLNPLEEGKYHFSAQVFDLAGNQVLPAPWKSIFVIDKTAPVISFGLADNIFTKDSQHLVAVQIYDKSPIWTKIIVNGQTYLDDIAESNFEFVLKLQEGVNRIEIQSSDVAGNSTTHFINNVVVDSTPPVLSNILPKDGTTFSVVSFTVSGNSNEQLKRISVNGSPWTLGTDKMQFSGTFDSLFEGPIDLEIEAEDLAGNIANLVVPVVVSLKPLNANLVQVVPYPNESKLIVRGASGATKPGYKVTVAGSFFNYESTVAASDGSFEVTLEPFTEASVSVLDLSNGKKYAATISYGDVSDVLLSGKILSSSGDPLANVSVSIAGTSIGTTTDIGGSFVFSRTAIQKSITGDQILVVNASNANLPPEKANLHFGMTKVAISLGISQKNVLLRPIYLTPQILDGTETVIQASAGGTVTSPQAPGVQLVIPPGVTHFPNGQAISAITMTTIPSQFTTVLPVAYSMPSEVVALEPSGTIFSLPVEITLPNTNELAPGTDTVILLMNSKTGRWEIGGAGEVTADGGSIRSKPGLGIKHFSAAYATPLGPVALERKSKDKVGADSFNGAVQTVIQLPSFKSMEKEVAPTLVYKSTWAKPTAMLSNMLDLPNRELEITTPTTSGVNVVEVPFDVKYCSFIAIPPLNLFPSCKTEQEKYYRALEYEDHYTSNTISTEKVTAQFSFLNTQSEKIPFIGTPKLATLSYSVDLKNDSNKFVPSGIYPYTSHYEVHLKQLVLGTRRIIHVTDLAGGSAQMKDNTLDIKDEIKLDPVFPPDLSGQMYVQNHIESEAGQGWKIGGVQKILNLADDKILLEEADGSVKTYSVENTIETLFNANQKGADLSGGVGISQWPNLFVKDKEQNKVLKFDLSSANQSAISSYAMLPTFSGQIAGYQYNQIDEVTQVPRRVCTNRKSWPGGNMCVSYAIVYDTYHNYKSICDSEMYSFSVSPLPYEILQSPDGLIYGTDSRMNAIFSATDSIANRAAGVTRQAPRFGTTAWNLPNYSSAPINNYCSERSLNCQLSWKKPTQVITGQWQCGAVPTSSGIVPAKGIETETKWSFPRQYTITYYGLNSPKGFTPGLKPNQLVFADSGNHRISVVDVSSGAVTTVAGTGNYPDTIVTGNATSQNIQHPNDVVYDQLGNLYVSSEMGLIRKVNSLGQISLLAGNLSGTELSDKTSFEKLKLVNPHGLAFDKVNNYLYVADTSQHRVVRLNLNTGEAVTVAGNYQNGYSGDGGNALDAKLSLPQEIALDDRGNLLIADVGNQRVRRVNFQNSSGGILRLSSSDRDGSKLTRNSDGTWERQDKNGSKAVFNSLGKQVASINPQGLQTTYEYDGNGRLVRVNLPTNQNILYSYSGDRLDSIVDAAGRTTSFTHNMKGQLTKVSFPDDSSKEYEYSSDGLLVKEYDQLSLKTEYQYNQYSRLSKVIRPLGPPITVDDSLSSTAVNGSDTDNPTNLETASENIPPNVIKDANGNTTTFTETYDGLIASIVDPRGQKTEIEYDLLGRVVKLIKPSLKVRTIEYDGDFNRVKKIMDEETRKITTFAYNLRGDVTAEEERSLDDPGFLKGTYRTLMSNGLVESESNHIGIIKKYTYNSFGSPSRVELHNGSLISWVEHDYDQYGNIIATRQSSGDRVSLTLDPAGNIISKTVNEVVLGGYEYDRLNRLTKVLSPKNELTQYNYSKRGELKEIIDPNEQRTLFEFDELGRVTSKTNPQGKVWHYEYDFNGNLTKEIDPNNASKVFEYSATNKLKKKILPDNAILLDYDLNGNVSKIENSFVAIGFEYDDLQRLVKETNAGKNNLHSWELTRSYNVSGQVSRVSASYYGTNNYTFNSMDQLTLISNFKNESFALSYDEVGRLTTLNRLNLLLRNNFGADQRLSSIENISDGVLKSSLNYTYSSSGLIRTISHSRGTAISYMYNENKYLSNVSHSMIGERSPASIGLQAEVFEYDALGNRSSDSNGSYSYDPTGQELKEDYKWRYNYDNNGNLIQKFNKDSGEWVGYKYSSENQLVEVLYFPEVLSSTPYKVVKYVYDPIGRRVEKSVVDNRSINDPQKTFTRRYVYDGEEIISEIDENNEVLARYTHMGLGTDEVLAVDVSEAGVSRKIAQSSGSYSFIKDHLGTIREIANSNGNIIQKTHYTSFGEIKAYTDENDVELVGGPLVSTAFAYTGREWDNETGLYYYRARYYDPGNGRFLQQDPEPGNTINPITVINRYTYVGNNPVHFVDPTGKIFGIDDFIFIMFAMAIGGFLKDYDRQGGNFFDNFAEGAVRGLVAGAALIGIYYGVNAIVNAGIEIFSDFGFATQDLGRLIAAFKHGFMSGSPYGQIAASIVTAIAVPGIFGGIGNYSGLLSVTERDLSNAKKIQYVGWVTVGGNFASWPVPWN